MDAEEVPIIERVISTDTKEAIQIKEKRMEVELAKLEARLKQTKDNDIKLQSYHYNGTKKVLEFQYQIKEKTYKFALDLNNNYPFLPPQIHFDIPVDATSPCEFQSTSLDEILGEQWGPCLHLWSIAERCGDYLSVCLTDIEQSKNALSSIQHLFCIAKSFNRPKLTLTLLILVSIIFRLCIVFLALYSSEDYVLHKHWIIRNTTTSPETWYNDSGYEYNPPLYMYFQYAMGSIFSYFTSGLSDSIVLKVYVKMVIIAFDVLLMISGVVYFVHRFYRNLEFSHKFTFLFLVLNTPCVLLFDYGKLNYNCIVLGLSLWSVILLTSKYYTAAAMLFSLAINFEQRIIYYTLPYFLYLAAKIFIDSKDLYKSFFLKQTDLRLAAKLFQYLYCFLKLGCIVIIIVGVNLILWVPYVFSDTPTYQQILHKLFPMSTEVEERIVPNLWHLLNVFNLSFEKTNIISAILIVISSIPSVITILKRSNLKCFLIGLFNISMAFFLFSYATNGQDIIFSLMPFVMMFYNYIHVLTTTILLALFSNYFQFSSNGLVAVYFIALIACILIGYEYEHGYSQNFNNSLKLDTSKSWIITGITSIKKNQRTIQILTLILLIVFHLLESISSLYGGRREVLMKLNAILSFIGFIGIWLYSHMLMYGNAINSEDEDTNLIYTLKKISKSKRV